MVMGVSMLAHTLLCIHSIPTKYTHTYMVLGGVFKRSHLQQYGKEREV